jgi:hypothetical protein
MTESCTKPKSLQLGQFIKRPWQAPAQQGGDSEKQVFGVKELLKNPCDGRIIAKATGKTQFAP